MIRGSLVLTEGRSGSNWLISLTNGTGEMGNGGEWFASWYLKKSMPRTASELVDRVLTKASTPNGYFCVKVFPAHVHFVQIMYGFDLIKYFSDHYDTNLVRLSRADLFRQAISYARGVQTNQWTKQSVPKGAEYYDFDTICRCYFLLARSESYWSTYLGLRQFRAASFVYEDLVENPRPFVECVGNHSGTTVTSIPQSKHSIQRDELTENWLARFIQDASTKGIVAQSTPSRQPRTTISNLVRLVGGKALKPYPYTF